MWEIKNENLINSMTGYGGKFKIDIPMLVTRYEWRTFLVNAKLSISRSLQLYNGWKSTLFYSAIHHTYADRLSERIRVLYRNQGFLPHKWATIVAASLPQHHIIYNLRKIAAYRIDSITTIWHDMNEREWKNWKLKKKWVLIHKICVLWQFFYIWKM